MPKRAEKQEPPKPPPSSPQERGGSDVLSRIKGIGFDANEGIKCIFYGQSGTGKTTLWATFPGRTLAIISSGGLKPGELRSVDTPEYRKKIDTVVLERSMEMWDLIAHTKEGNYNTVVIDHVTGLQDLVLKEILGLDEVPVMKGWGMAHMAQYGQCIQQCKEFLRGLLNLDCNVVIIGQERTFGGSDDGVVSDSIKPTVGIAVMPNLAGWLNPAADYVLQTFKRAKMVKEKRTTAGKTEEVEVRGKGVEYCVRIEPHDTYMTKFRGPRGKVLPDVIVDCTYDKLIKLIRT